MYTYDQCKLSCDNIGLHKYVSYSVISDFTVSLGIYHYLIVGSRVQNKNNSLQFAKDKGTGAKAGTSAHQQVIDGIRSRIIL